MQHNIHDHIRIILTFTEISRKVEVSEITEINFKTQIILVHLDYHPISSQKIKYLQRKTEVDVENNSSNKIYTATTLPEVETVENHKFMLFSFGLSAKNDDCDFPYRLCTGFLTPQESRQTTSQSWICKMYHQTYFKTFNSCQRGSADLQQQLLLLYGY